MTLPSDELIVVLAVMADTTALLLIEATKTTIMPNSVRISPSAVSRNTNFFVCDIFL